MTKIFRIIGILFFFSILPVIHSKAQSTDTLRIVTYYPSPYGSYRELRAKRLAVGELYKSTKDYCWPEDNGSYTCTTPIYSDLDNNGSPTPGGAEENAVSLIVDGNVGIGTATPEAKLQVGGSVIVTNVDSPSSGFGTRIGYDTSGIAHNSGVPYGFIQAFEFANSVYKDFEVSGKNVWIATGENVADYKKTLYVTSAGNVGIGTTSPTTKIGQSGFLDAKDVWLRDANGGSGAWASQASSLKTYYAVGTTDESTTSTSYVLMPDMQLALPATFAGGNIFAFFSAKVFPTSPTVYDGGNIRLAIDGNEKTFDILGSTDSLHNLVWAGNLSAGAHTIQVQWKRNSATNVRQYAPGHGPRTLTVITAG